MHAHNAGAAPAPECPQVVEKRASAAVRQGARSKTAWSKTLLSPKPPAVAKLVAGRSVSFARRAHVSGVVTRTRKATQGPRERMQVTPI